MFDIILIIRIKLFLSFYHYHLNDIYLEHLFLYLSHFYLFQELISLCDAW